MSATPASASNGHLTGYGSASYRHYVLVLLMLVYTLNFIDRTLIAVVAQPIIESFQLTDAQWGLLYGPPFAIFYAIMGLPIALWADRSNRVNIIALCIVLWSIMTALCGVAMGFFSLLMFRIGVAIGEAGCTPPANSLIGDYFIARKRATALGVYSMGVTLGSVLANVFGGPIAQMEGAAVAQVCHEYGKPCLVIRTISDNADHSASVDFDKFLVEIASQYILGIVKAFFVAAAKNN